MDKISNKPSTSQPLTMRASDLPRGGGAGGREGEALPCLFSNNSIEAIKITDQTGLDTVTALCSVLSPNQKKVAQTLRLNVERLATKVAPSIEYLAFLTLTFEDNVTDHREAYKRFRSFNSNYFSSSPHFKEWVITKERQKRGAWHYHMIVVVDGDIKTGFDFDAYKNWTKGSNRFNTSFPTGNKYIRQLWYDLGQNLEKYGLGKIFSLEPIHSNAEAIGKYVGKYISKHMDQRETEDKGVRLVNYSKNWVRNYANFAWNTENAQKWREKLKFFAQMNGCQEFYQLTEKLGPNWAYNHAQDIVDVYENVGLIVQNKDTEYVPPIIEKVERNKQVKDRKRIPKRERQKALEKRQFQAELSSLVKDYVKQNEGGSNCTRSQQFNMENLKT